MKTKKQEKLINNFLSELSDELRPLYGEIIDCLSDCGYNPQKERTNLSFKHNLHNKQMAKMGFRNPNGFSFFALRFSACTGYSQRFCDIVCAMIEKYPSKIAMCVDGNCRYCAGEPLTHVYTHICQNGETKFHCGAYALEIPNLSVEDIAEIKLLVTEEHRYLMKYQVGIE